MTEAQTPYDAGEATASKLRVEDVFSAVVQAAVSITQAEEGYLLLRDLQSDELYLRASQNRGEAHAKSHCARAEDRIARQVIRSGEPMALRFEGEGSIEFACKRSADGNSRRVRSLVYVPVHNQKRVSGVLGVANMLSDTAFSESDVALLGTLADLAAIVLSDARSYTRTDQALSRVFVELSATQYKADLILDNISDGVFTVNRDLRITSANAAMERITGWRENEMLGLRYDELLAPQLGGHRLYAEQTVPGKAIHTQSPIPTTQSTILRKDDRRITVIGLAAPLRANDASVTGALTILRDITPQAKLVAKHRETDGTHESHILRLESMAENALHTLYLESGSVPSHCHPITLRPIVSQVVKHFQDVLSSSSFQVALAPDLPFAVGNESKLEMALVNLVENALVVCHPEYPIYITADADEAYVYMAVEGMGLEEEKRSQFQPLSPTAGPDTNDDLHFSWWATPQVKLYVASKLIEAQGGHVWTENRSGKRTRFNLSLPRIEAHDVAEAFVD